MFFGFLSARLFGSGFSPVSGSGGALPGFLPASAFPCAWFLFYLTEGAAYSLALCAPCSARKHGSAAYIYFLSIFIAFFFPLLFFSMRALSFALIWEILYLIAFLAMAVLFWRCRKAAAVLLLPCIGFLIYCIVVSGAILRSR